jgi:archaellum component FlaF (FlaF/FlaG flagellin family)
LTACSTDRLSNIPGNATLASSGDERVSYTVPSDGTVWVYDSTNDKIDYSGPVAMNQSIVVEPTNHQVLVDGRVVNDKLTRDAQHRVYFLAGSTN